MGGQHGKEKTPVKMVKGQYPERSGDPTNCLFSDNDWSGWRVFVDKEGHGFCNTHYDNQKYYFQELPPTEILMTKSGGEKVLFVMIDMVGTWIGSSCWVIYCNPKHGLLSGECIKFTPHDVKKHQAQYKAGKVGEVELIEKLVDLDAMNTVPHQRPIVSLNPKEYGADTVIVPYREIDATFNGKPVLRKIDAPTSTVAPPSTKEAAMKMQAQAAKNAKVEKQMKAHQSKSKGKETKGKSKSKSKK